MYFDVGNLLELPAAAVLLCGCRSWLPVAAALGSSKTGPRAARRAAAGCAADSAASRLREVLACAGATSFWVTGPTGPISMYGTPSTSLLCQGALALGHVFVEASTMRRHDEFAAC
jgi:hypothetical protein